MLAMLPEIYGDGWMSGRKQARLVRAADCCARFARSSDGHFGMMMGFVALPLVLSAGVAVDFARISTHHNELQQALDAAALAIARDGKTITTEQAKAIAQRFIASNFDPDYTDLSVVRDGTSVRVAAKAKVELSFGNVIGYRDWPINAQSEADIAYNDYEIALVLDTTGSMAGGKLASMKDAVLGLVDTMSEQVNNEKKLKFAVVPFANFVNVGTGFAPSFKKNGKLKPGTGADWLDLKGESDVPQTELVKGVSRFELARKLKLDWTGCVETRYGGGDEAHDVLDTPADPKDSLSLFVPAFAIDEPSGEQYRNDYIASHVDPLSSPPVHRLLKYGFDLLEGLPLLHSPPVNSSGGKGPNKECVTQPIVPLSSDYDTIRKKVKSLQASGTTNIMEGVAWGMRVLSPHAPFTEGQPSRPGLEKIMIVLTDGSNVFGNASSSKNVFGSSYSSNGYLIDGRLGIASGSASATNAAMNKKTLAACEAAKKQGLVVYTIRLEEPDVKTGMMLKECASSPAHFFDAPSRSQLDEVFSKIREGVVRVRISS